MLMGIWDELRSTALSLIKRKASGVTSGQNARRSPYSSIVPTAGTKIGDAVSLNAAQRLEEYVPEPDRHDKIGRILTNLSRFAVDSAIDESLKGVTGGIQVYKIVKEGLKDHPTSHPSSGKQDPALVMEEIQAKMEKMQEDMIKIKQQNKTSTQCVAGLEPSKDLPNEPTKGSAPPKTNAKKILMDIRK
ncbi:unnamed protein product [Ilex paraguariensis]|uniref:Uncharacterized protein n=1 Tax=Ilex paraguariensis TaxID=185542 RepID=A0ABC8SSL8_9AQUA